MKRLILLLLLVAVTVVISAQNYNERNYQTVSVAGVTLNYQVVDSPPILDCQLISTTTGWVAAGFDPALQMQASNIIIGYHSNGNTVIRDDYGITTTSHASDTSLGGTNDIITSSSTEIAGVTQLNFMIPLNSGDIFDKTLVIGNTYNVILSHAANGGDDFAAAHLERGVVSITIPQPSAAEDDVILPAVSGLRIYPNPFTGEAKLSFNLKEAVRAEIKVFNSRGQLVKTIPQQNFSKGENLLQLDNRNDWGKPLSTGVYFLTLKTGNGILTGKFLLMASR